MTNMRHGVAVLALALALAACGGGNEQQQQGAPQGPPSVGYVVVREQAVTLTTELPGRTTAFETTGW
jgi:membrane fusion protein (multidrug efflux system)